MILLISVHRQHTGYQYTTIRYNNLNVNKGVLTDSKIYMNLI